MKSEKKSRIGIAIGAAIGIAIGATIVLATNNLKIGIGIGIVLGVAIGAIFKLKKYPKIKWTLISIVGLSILLVSFGAWFISLLPIEEMKKDLSMSKVEDISYLSQNKIPQEVKY